MLAEVGGKIYFMSYSAAILDTRALFSSPLLRHRKASASSSTPGRNDPDTAVRIKPGPARPNDFALIIGIDRYRGVPQASYAERDAALFRKYAVATLGVPEKNAVLLSGDRARLSDITNHIEAWLPKVSRPGSRVYFYFSGHGAPDPAKGNSYLIPWDGDPSFLISSAYSVQRLYSKLEELNAREVVVALDACFSGIWSRSIIAPGLRPLVRTVETPLMDKSKLSVLTAARSDEVAGSIDERGHGLFTYYVLKGLQGEASDSSGRLTLGGLHSFVQKKVQSEARRQNRDQTPQIFSSTPGLILR